MTALKMSCRMFVKAASVCLVLLSTSQVYAEVPAFDIWLKDLKTEALQGGVSQQVLDEALDGVTLNPRVIELDRRQPEFSMTFERYIKTRLSETRINKGREKVAANHTLLNDVSEKYGVDGRFIAAIWGLETNYGGYTGNMNTVRSLVTLAYDPRRSAFFRKELLSALKILSEGHISVANMKGSWAGAMGQSQFMPTSFHGYARDHNGDGRRDIWTTEADVFASIANYLKKHKWSANGTWGRPVTLPEGFSLTSPDVKRTTKPKRCRRALKTHTRMLPLSRWQELGVRRLNGGDLPQVDIEASLVQPSGEGGQAYLTYANYRSILGYNCSNFYGIAVGLLADKFKDGAP